MQLIPKGLLKADTAAKTTEVIFSRDPSTLFSSDQLFTTGGRLLAALFVGWLAYFALKLILRRVERSLGDPDPTRISLQEQRIRTLLPLGRTVGLVVIVIIVLLMMLSALGVNMGPLLAGVGVIGLAISFGAQSLVKDIISGLFILFENQFGVGDVIRIDTVSGAVESMTLRVVVLRDIHGVVHIIPNGEIKRVSNLTRSWSRVVLDVGIAYKEDADRVMDAMRDVGRELWEDADWRPLLVEELVVPGIEAFAESSMNIRIMAKTLPLKQWDVARELRRRLKRRFDRDGIEIPFPHRTMFWGEGQSPAALAGMQTSGSGVGEHGPGPAM